MQALADFSRPIEPQLREQNLVPIVQAVIQLISAEAESADIRIALEEDRPGASVPVLCDAELMRQALLNIALNAMQAMPTGGDLLGERRQRSSWSAHPRARLRLRHSHGDKLPRIFDLYFTTKPTGSGIGLAMTYRIVQLHGGVIEVKSEKRSCGRGPRHQLHAAHASGGPHGGSHAHGGDRMTRTRALGCVATCALLVLCGCHRTVIVAAAPPAATAGDGECASADASVRA